MNSENYRLVLTEKQKEELRESGDCIIKLSISLSPRTERAVCDHYCVKEEEEDEKIGFHGDSFECYSPVTPRRDADEASLQDNEVVDAIVSLSSPGEHRTSERLSVAFENSALLKTATCPSRTQSQLSDPFCTDCTTFRLHKTDSSIGLVSNGSVVVLPLSSFECPHGKTHLALPLRLVNFFVPSGSDLFSIEDCGFVTTITEYANCKPASQILDGRDLVHGDGWIYYLPLMNVDSRVKLVRLETCDQVWFRTPIRLNHHERENSERANLNHLPGNKRGRKRGARSETPASVGRHTVSKKARVCLSPAFREEQ